MLPQDEYGNAKVGKDIRLYECKNCAIHTTDKSKVVVQGLNGYIVAEKHGQLLVCSSIEEKNKIEELLAQENYQIGNFTKFYNQGSNGIYD